jgi:hypothetical protein
MPTLIERFKEFLKSSWHAFDLAAKAKATDIIEFELAELQNIFGIIVIGAFVGMASPPMQISLDLLPYMDEELLIVMNKISTANTPISELVSILDVH